MGRRDYANLLLLAKLGLWANEVATLTLDDIDWRASEILVRAKGRQHARMPIPRRWRGHHCISAESPPKVVVPTVVRPHTRAAHRVCSGCAITMIAKATSIALELTVRTLRGPYLPI
ncbi:hypothetical protein [Bradyrhizobium sp. STM 3561]|uniref:hypothetical protein n=1 Tax=Bradyrhizobium sp. STM 3561 TaxID=578923 RepID=UPI00388DAB00